MSLSSSSSESEDDDDRESASQEDSQDSDVEQKPIRMNASFGEYILKTSSLSRFIHCIFEVLSQVLKIVICAASISHTKTAFQINPSPPPKNSQIKVTSLEMVECPACSHSRECLSCRFNLRTPPKAIPLNRLCPLRTTRTPKRARLLHGVWRISFQERPPTP